MVAAATLVMLIEEVLEARIVSGLIVRDRERNMDSLTEKDSGAACTSYPSV